MLEMKIEEKLCRGCQLCHDICPTDCFNFDEETQKTTVARVANCISCFSCVYMCPASAISYSDHHLVKNFYRNIEFSKRMAKFL